MQKFKFKFKPLKKDTKPLSFKQYERIIKLDNWIGRLRSEILTDCKEMDNKFKQTVNQ